MPLPRTRDRAGPPAGRSLGQPDLPLSKRRLWRRFGFSDAGEPITVGVEGWLRRDDRGFLVTGLDLLADDPERAWWPLERDPMPLESSEPGIFVAGDVRHGSVKRIASAVGEGALAVQLVHRYLAS